MQVLACLPRQTGGENLALFSLPAFWDATMANCCDASDQSASVTAVCRRPEGSSRRPGAVLPRSLTPSLPLLASNGVASQSCQGLRPATHSPPTRPRLTHAPPTPRTSRCHYPTTTAGPGTPHPELEPPQDMIPVPPLDYPRHLCRHMRTRTHAAPDPSSPLLQRSAKPSPRRFHDPRPLTMSSIVPYLAPAFLFLTTR